MVWIPLRRIKENGSQRIRSWRSKLVRTESERKEEARRVVRNILCLWRGR